MDNGLMVAAVVIVIGVVMALRLRRRRMTRANQRPLVPYGTAVRPQQKERMQPGVEYCHVSFMGDWGKTEVTYYGGLSERHESFADTTGFGARDFRKKLLRQGWTLTESFGHKEGNDSYFERQQT